MLAPLPLGLKFLQVKKLKTAMGWRCLPRKCGLVQATKMDPIPEHGPNAPSMAPPQLHTAAPVTQAARNFVDHTNEPAAARRLRKQQEMAQRKGRRGARFVQLGAHNACNIALPPHIQQVGSGQGERSIMVLDHRDLRLQSPFQGWLLDEILTNAGARIREMDAKVKRETNALAQTRSQLIIK